jgi:glycosyltransferase involved in cell wall biosynthesis
VHILLIHQLFIRPQDPGGTRHYEFARHLVNRGHRVTVLAGDRSYLSGASQAAAGLEQLEPGLQVLRSRIPAGGQRSFLRRSLGFLAFLAASLASGLRVPGVDAVWGTSPPLTQGLAAWALARLKGVPWVFEVRDLWPDFAVAMGVLRSRPLIRLAKGLERFLYRRADRLVVNSPGFLEPLRREGAPADRITLVANGVDSSAFEQAPDGSSLRALHGLQGKFIALYAGAHGPANDLDVVLQAAQALREDPRIVFLLVGDGMEKPALRRRAAGLQLDNLRFLPPIPKSDMPELLAAADCGLAVLRPIPLFATTFPNKVFDYMAAARPVVLAIQGPIRQVVEMAGAGIAVAPGDPQAMAQAVARLADEPALRSQMGQKGRACVKAAYERSQQADRLEAVFAELVAAG